MPGRNASSARPILPTRWRFLPSCDGFAIAEALMVHRTLDAAMIDTIIASAPERARRINWNGVLENAARFTAGLES
jgi:hypothetical protein